jgi:hypothetical protein
MIEYGTGTYEESDTMAAHMLLGDSYLSGVKAKGAERSLTELLFSLQGFMMPSLSF